MRKRNKKRRKQNINDNNEIIESGDKEFDIWIKDIQPKSDKQRQYIESILKHDITFCFGPAGTGKTFLACNVAAKLLVEDKIEYILLCRPAVESGEQLGFLPGTIEEKINPHLRPLYDALNFMLSPKVVAELLNAGVIEASPLAYMRGRTLSNALIILDEAQNTTVEQMKMFLTRMGDGSKLVINGDITQSDLINKYSGLSDAKQKLSKVDGIAWIEMGKEDIVRHPMVQKIVEAYEQP